MSLPVDDRPELIENLWDSIEAEVADTLPIPGWHREEIDRRLDGLDAGTSIGATWAEVRERSARRS